MTADPMPVFVIKGKDQLAVEAVRAYRRLCEEHGLDGQAREVGAALKEIRLWQQRNADLVHLPNHRHVPVQADPEVSAADTELAELRALFEMQQRRMQEATALWRAEAPEERALVLPDLGNLLTWLMARADTRPQARPDADVKTMEPPWYRADLAATKAYLYDEAAKGAALYAGTATEAVTSERRRHMMRISAMSMIESVTLSGTLSDAQKVDSCTCVSNALGWALQDEIVNRSDGT